MSKYLNLIILTFNKTKEYYYNKNYKREEIYIVGNGWSSYYLTKYLDKTKYKLMIISENKNITNTPKLVKSLFNEKNNNFENPYSNIILDKVIDIKDNKIITKNNKKFNYKNVVFCIGSDTNDYGIEGVKEYSFKFKTINDKYKLKDKLKDNNIKNICVIGSGAVGIELSVLLKNKGYNIKIIEGMNDILPGFNKNTKLDIEEYLKNKNIELYKNNFVKSINEKTIITNKETFDYDLVIWSGGIKFSGYETTTLFKTLNNIKKISPRGIEVKDNFSINEENNIFCIGDIVSNKGPPTAQNAKNQALWLSKYLNNNKKNIEEFKIEEKGKILHLDNEMYLESNNYNGFVWKPFNYLLDIGVDMDI